MTLSIVSACLHLVTYVQKQREVLKESEFSLIRIVERISGLQPALHELSCLNEDDFTLAQRQAVSNLQEVLQRAGKLIDSQSNLGWWSRRFNARERRKEFQHIHEQLDDRVQELQLSLSSANIRMQLPHYWRIDESQKNNDEEQDLLARRKRLEWARQVLLDGGRNVTELEKVRAEVPANTDKHRLVMIGEALMEINVNLADLGKRRDEEELATSVSTSGEMVSKVDVSSRAWLINLTDLDPHPMVGVKKPLSHSNGTVVYRARFMGTNDVIVKVLDPKVMNERARNELKCTLNAMCSIQSPRIVRVFGGCLEPPYACLVQEYVENGLLDDHLRDKDSKLTASRVLRVAKSIGEGIAYLHKIDLLHRFIVPHSILLDRNWNAKLGEFGLDTIIGHKHGKQSRRYMPPEWFVNNEYDSKSEVYAFAMTMYHIISGHVPYNNVDDERLEAYQLKHKHPKITKHVGKLCSEELANLINACWRGDPIERPDSMSVAGMLRDMWREHVASGKATDVNPQVAALASRVRLKMRENTAAIKEKEAANHEAEKKLLELQKSHDHWNAVAAQLRQENVVQEEQRELMVRKLNQDIERQQQLVKDEKARSEQIEMETSRRVQQLEFTRTCQQCVISQIKPSRYLCRNTSDGKIVACVYQLAHKLIHALQWRVVFDDGDGDGHDDVRRCQLVNLGSNQVLQWDGTTQSVSLTYMAGNPIAGSTPQCWWRLHTCENSTFHQLATDDNRWQLHMDVRHVSGSVRLVTRDSQNEKSCVCIRDGVRLDVELTEKVVRLYTNAFRMCIENTFFMFCSLPFNRYLIPRDEDSVCGEYYEKVEDIRELHFRLIPVAHHHDRRLSVPTLFAPFRCQIVHVNREGAMLCMDEESGIKCYGADKVTLENSIWLAYPLGEYGTTCRIVHERTRLQLAMPKWEERDHNAKSGVEFDEAHVDRRTCFTLLPDCRPPHLNVDEVGTVIFNPHTNQYVMGGEYAMARDSRGGDRLRRIYHWRIYADSESKRGEPIRCQIVYTASARPLGWTPEHTTILRDELYSSVTSQSEMYWWWLYPHETRDNYYRIVNCDSNMQLSILPKDENEEALGAYKPYELDVDNQLGCRDECYWFEFHTVYDFDGERIDDISSTIVDALDNFDLW